MRIDKNFISGWSLFIGRFFRRLPRNILFDYFSVIRLVVLVLWAGMMIYLVAQIIFVPMEEGMESPVVHLQTEDLDDVESWLDERERQQDRNIFRGVDSSFR